MKVGIICASEDELAPFLPVIKNCNICEKAMLRFYEGDICGVKAIAVFSGVCKVNAAIASQVLIDTFGATAIINAGTAGGMDAQLDLFDTVISTEVCYHDIAPDILTEYHPWMPTIFFEADRRLLELSKIAAKNETAGRVFWGRMATGESFITDQGREQIMEKFAPLTVDMETASIAHVCYVNRIPFLSIRCVTDTANHSETGSFEKNCVKASEIAGRLAINIIKQLSCD